jgi:hypothetical protein
MTTRYVLAALRGIARPDLIGFSRRNAMTFTLGWVLFVLGTAAVAGCLFAITVRGEHGPGDAGHGSGDHGHGSH